MRLVSSLLLLVPSIAAAQEITAVAPAPPPPPGIALAPNALNLTYTVEMDATEGKLGDTVAIAPDVAYGLTGDLTVSVVHSRFAVTGFRAAAGGGFCVTDACPSTYRNVGIEALRNVRRGDLAVAAIGGLHALDLDAGFYGAKIGLRARYAAGAFSAQLSPAVIVALGDRDGMPANHDTLWVPVQVAFKLSRVTLGLGSGVKGVADDLGNTWELPVGASVQVALMRDLTIGGSFVFGKIVGGAGDAMTGPEYRGVQVWLSHTQRFDR